MEHEHTGKLKSIFNSNAGSLYSNSTQVISSDAGYSTLGFANISNLTPNTQYSYTIEVVNGTQDQKLSGVFSTSSLPTPPAVDPTIVLDEQTDPTSVANSLANAVCPVLLPLLCVLEMTMQALKQAHYLE